ncbi:uncharacterized protein LOC124604528 [Schistocerca americana]|uniref:uncharacterized protein LOC124604528 n=1 Tax=Schistocerca americana TaxID=7009 RepID=UPI001F4FF33B|nr:uncharacterized protein LOC124604528 [Schistocerca americana]XP_049957500.1 uncharacterized protein LOC126474114 [Schistocerca serialis cubense]
MWILERLPIGLGIILLFVVYGESLECYVCTSQETNGEKCLNTIKTCEQGEDVCLTEIKWGSTPYWSQGAQKQYYVSKRCSTKSACEKIRSKNMPYCTHIWYQDWRCAECCQGDRCNFYVFLSGSTARSSLFVVLASVSVILAVGRFLQ